MVSDVNGTVIAIQGNPISSETLGASEDGYVLTWDNTDGYLVARPVLSGYTGLRQAYFTSSGGWTCPAGVTNVMVIGCGGGGGGAGGTGYGTSPPYYGGGGGGASIQQISNVGVTPGNIYAITVGVGGSGGSGGAAGAAGNGNDGGSTTIAHSSSTLFSAIGGGGAGITGINWVSGNNWAANNYLPQYPTSPGPVITNTPGAGGTGGFSGSTNGNAGSLNYLNVYSPGMAGGSGSAEGGGGGGAGAQGNGANGSSGNYSANASAGANASANTAAGGGGGGASGLADGGAGGNGGSGYLYILY
jgi:hypothetical protein